MQPDSLAFRICILLSAAGLSISSVSLSQIYAVLQPVMTRARGCVETNGTEGTDCCTDCLGINDFNYNIFHSITIFVGILSPLIGFLMDKWGNSVSILITLCSVIGTALVALASCVSSSWLTVSLMFVGAAFWGVGFLPVYVARERIIGVWFKDKNLRLAFGVSAAINRIPSLFTYTLTEKLRESVGLQLTLWMATLVCVFSLACAVCASALDAHGNRKLGLTDQIKQEASHVKIFDIRHARLEFWLLLGGFSFLSTVVYTYMDNSVEFISEKFSFTQSQAAISGGFLMYIGIFASPLAGLAIDAFGRSSFVFAGAAFLTVPAFVLLTFSDVHPAVGGAMNGIAYSFVSPAAFASVPVVVPRATLGVATALCMGGMSLMMICAHVGIGWILGWELGLPVSVRLHRWTLAMSLILANACAAFAFAASLAVYSWLQDGPLSSSSSREYQPIEGDAELIKSGLQETDDDVTE